MKDSFIAYETFKNEINDVRIHLEITTKIENIVRSKEYNIPNIEEIRSQLTKRKIFNYRANIISLYGAFEYFIEEIFKEYITDLKSILPKFNALDESVRKNYFKNIAKLHSRLHYQKFSHLNEKQIAQNIEKVIVQDINDIIPECFLGNGGNYKHDKICDLMTSIGIYNLKEKIKELLFEKLSVNLQNTKKEFQLNSLDSKIDDFVNRRNEVAHSTSIQTIQLDDNDYFIDLIDSLELYSLSLNNVLKNELIQSMWNYNTAKQYKISNVYPNHNVIELRITNQCVKNGCKFLLYRKSEKKIFESEIKELRIKNDKNEIETVDEIDADNSEQLISIKSSFPIKNCKYKVLFLE